MSQDNDVERLFSWLQTPDIHYREFAGAREVTDSAIIYQTRTDTPEVETPAPHNVQLDEEYPADQFPDQVQEHVEVEPAGYRRLPAAPQPSSPAAPSVEAGPFALGPAGRGAPAAPPVPTAPLAPAAPPPAAAPSAAPTPQGGLLGGAFREEGEPPASTPAPEPHEDNQGRSLDSVFSRLSGGRASMPDPRDRLRHIPGLGPTTGRPR